MGGDSLIQEPEVEVSYPSGNQLLFYSKGFLINRISFVHVYWNMDMQGPMDLLKNITEDLVRQLKHELAKVNKPIKSFELKQGTSSIWDNQQLQDLFSEKSMDGAVVCLTLVDMFSRIQTQLNSLLKSVPDNYDVKDNVLLHRRVKRSAEFVSNETFSYIDDPFLMRCLNPHLKNRTRREILGGVALGVGIWNSFRINNIESHIEKLSSKYNSLVDYVSLMGNRHAQMMADVELMKRLLHMLTSNNYRKILASAMSTSDRLRDTVDNVVEIVTSGRQRRISPRLINGDDLIEMFYNLQQKAKELNSVLLLEQPTDLYDVQASYGYDQSGLVFRVYAHVPLASETETLSLYEHVPFPLSYQSLKANLTITPDTGVDKYLAVLSVGENHRYRVLSEVDIQNCFKLRNYFLCSGRNILRLDMQNSCIGSLWLMDQGLVLKNCLMKREPLQEVAVKLSPQEWLVFSPEPLTKSAKCNKGLTQNIRFEKQTRLSMPEDCEVSLSRFHLSTDSNIFVDFKIKVHEWRYFGKVFSTNVPDNHSFDHVIDQITVSRDMYEEDLEFLKHKFKATDDFLSKVWNSISNLNLFSMFGNVYMFLIYVAVIWLLIVCLLQGWYKKLLCCFRKRKVRNDSSIIRPVRTSSIRYSKPSETVILRPDQGPPPYESISEEATAPIVVSNDEPPTIAHSVGYRPDGSIVGSNLWTDKSSCFLRKIPEGQDSANFVCHHHDPIHGCNGIFRQKMFPITKK